MSHLPPHYHPGTHAIHHNEGADSLGSHLQPIYQSSTFGFPDVETGAAIMTGQQPGYVYTRAGNPTIDHLARKYALLEGLGLIRANPDADPDSLVRAIVFASGMAAISSAILARVRSGETLLVQRPLYNSSYTYLTDVLPRFGVQTVWVEDLTPGGWEVAIKANPKASLIYIETPSNPGLTIVDIAAVVDAAHRHGLWVMADNTFATPYCQRPLDLGVDIVAHSATKYLTGHGTHLAGAVVSPHVDWVNKELGLMLKSHGGSPSPFECWLGNIGIKTFALRMERHCANAMAVARFLAGHPKVAEVRYPGIESHPGHLTAQKQMSQFGGMLAFELKGGAEAARKLLPLMRTATIAASLGNVDSLIQIASAMNYCAVPLDVQTRMGITPGLIRYSVGVEDTADILDDLEQALNV